MTKNKKEFVFDFGLVKIYNQNTLLIDYNPHTIVTVDILNKINEARLELLGDIPHNCIVIADVDFITIDHESKLAHAQGKYHQGKIMNDSIVIKGMGPKMEAALYKNSFKPLAHTKFFDSVDKAKAWIDSLS